MQRDGLPSRFVCSLLQDARNAQAITLKNRHAVHALETLVVVNRAAGFYRLIRAITATSLTRLAAFTAPLDPVLHPAGTDSDSTL